VRLFARFHLLARVASLAVILLSCLVLAGWTLEIEALKTVLPRMVAMNPGGTAIGFLLAGTSLWLLLEHDSRRMHRIGKALAMAVVVLALLRLAGYTIGWDNGPDRWLFPQRLEQYDTPNRMAPNTAVCFLLCGLALALMDVKFGRNIRPAELLSLAAALIALLAIIGYSYSACIMMKALAENRDKRYATAGEFAVEIRRFLKNRLDAKRDSESLVEPDANEKSDS
jgi:hypothetical protein